MISKPVCRVFLSAVLFMPLAPVDALCQKTHSRTFTLADRTVSNGLLLPEGFSVSRSVSHPGLNVSTGFLAGVGVLTPSAEEWKYGWQPATGLNPDHTKSHLSPYVYAQAPFEPLSIGMYVGNPTAAVVKHGGTVRSDSLRDYSRRDIGLEGAIWMVPKMAKLLGVSLDVRGVYDTRALHWLAGDERRRLHSLFDFKRKGGSGKLTVLTNPIGAHFVSASVRYRRLTTESTESRRDTLFFSSAAFVDTAELIDSSTVHGATRMGLEYLWRSPDTLVLAGARLATDRQNTELTAQGQYLDSSTIDFSLFGETKLCRRFLTLHAGATLEYTATFYKQSVSDLGYVELLKEYTLERIANTLGVRIPLAVSVNIRDVVEFWSGLVASGRYTSSNHLAWRDLEQHRSEGAYDIELNPLVVRVIPGERLIVSVVPEISDGLLEGGLELHFRL